MNVMCMRTDVSCRTFKTSYLSCYEKVPENQTSAAEKPSAAAVVGEDVLDTVADTHEHVLDRAEQI